MGRRRRKERSLDKKERSFEKRRTRKKKSLSKISNTTETEIRFKCYFNEEIRIVPFSSSVKYKELIDKFSKEYEDSLLLQYKDEVSR